MTPNAKCPNIYVIGPQSTGKTSLVKQLRSQLGTWLANTSIDQPQIISEVARTVLSKHKLTAEDVTASEKRCRTLQRLILEAQAQAEKEGLMKSSWLISDRSGVDPLVYAKRFASTKAAAELQRHDAWIELRGRMADSLIVVCESGTPWLTDDRVRLMPESEEAWKQLFDDFCELLHDVGLCYVVVPRTMLDLSERADFVRLHWERQSRSVINN